jgi:hypothetical protein
VGIPSHYQIEGNKWLDFLVAKRRYANQATQQHEHTLPCIKSNYPEHYQKRTLTDLERKNKNKKWNMLLHKNNLILDLLR